MPRPYPLVRRDLHTWNNTVLTVPPTTSPVTFQYISQRRGRTLSPHVSCQGGPGLKIRSSDRTTSCPRIFVNFLSSSR
jgi:hypothetical protein